jgi:hypothetical protein
VLNALREAAASEADVKIVFDARVKANGPADANWEAIRKAKIEDLVIPRTKSRSAISHNKFIVLLHNGEPVEVWTGIDELYRRRHFRALELRSHCEKPGCRHRLLKVLGGIA